MKKSLVLFPDKILRKKSLKITNIDDDIVNLMNNMKDMMYNSNGIGLAGIQLGVDKRIIVADCARDTYDLKVLINPEIVEKNNVLIPSKEGCLSLPNIFEEIMRPKEVLVRSMDLNGKKIEIHGRGLLASCLVHEIEHLDGVLFIDHIKSRLKKDLIKSRVKKLTKKINKCYEQN